jgi:NTP pyrophosphatase (non-canonical NTP hydrolase)
MRLAELQQLMRDLYMPRDVSRGIEGTFMWLVEEIGELATALRSQDRAEQAAEFADVLAWLATIANVAGVDLEKAVADKYGNGCPGCQAIPCTCSEAEKP